jgi:biofilm PGA synthesis N-glycosyltransferase PgaC
MATVIPDTRPALETPQLRREFPVAVPAPTFRQALNDDLYLPVRSKFVIASAVAIVWTSLSVWLSQPWLRDLAGVTGWPLAIFVISFIAYVPGFMNSFLITTILMDRRPRRVAMTHYPDLSILVACYNEAQNIGRTITSLGLQQYPGRMDVLILDDGSSDDTAAVARAAVFALVATPGHSFRVIEGGANIGKAGVLNRGLAMARAGIVLTIDGDCWIYEDAVQRLVERYAADPSIPAPSPAPCWSAIRATTGSPRRRNGTTSTASPR